MRKARRGATTAELRRRPDQIRYHYLAAGVRNIHTGCSYAGLLYSLKHGGPFTQFFLTDLVTGQARLIPEPVESFMKRWRLHYNEPHWDYFLEVSPGTGKSTL